MSWGDELSTEKASSRLEGIKSSPFSALPSGKRFKAAEASSSSTNDLPAVNDLVSEAVAKELARDEVRFVDLTDGGGAKKSDVEKSPEATVEDVGVSVTDTEKAKLNESTANRGKKGQLKSQTGDAWGKLLSRSSQTPFPDEIPTSTSLVKFEEQDPCRNPEPLELESDSLSRSPSFQLCRNLVSSETSCPSKKPVVATVALSVPTRSLELVTPADKRTKQTGLE
ncbi:unnamed protein product [Fraxinus pennsylvanica]|uniref:Uncharacterized protein n=1 Tax=Fraxinus pennsylvanica TaxID=56036 RepID=A0AAD2A2T9_9LAMI|nr:unnamed protein product [Fraxinus pennsylvanica]